MMGGRLTLPLALDFDAGGFRAGKRMELFHAYARGLHPRILEAGRRDALGQGLGEIDMAGRNRRGFSP